MNTDQHGLLKRFQTYVRAERKIIETFDFQCEYRFLWPMNYTYQRITFQLMVIGALIPYAVSEPSFTETEFDSWSYSYKQTAGLSTGYYATSISEIEGAEYIGIVNYGPTRGNFYWGPDSTDVGFHIFETWVISNTTRTLQIIVGGDDGHSLFVDDLLLGGGGNAAGAVELDLNLVADIPKRLSLVVHNTGGPWAGQLVTQFDHKALNDLSGISFNAALKIAKLRTQTSTDFSAMIVEWESDSDLKLQGSIDFEVWEDIDHPFLFDGNLVIDLTGVRSSSQQQFFRLAPNTFRYE